MNLLVVSDSHRNLRPLREVIRLYEHQVEAVLHLGDHAEDLLCLRETFPSLPMHTVNGNCDLGFAGDTERILKMNGKKILMLHGHRQNVKVHVDRLVYYAEEKEVDACLFGHTHIPALFEVGPIVFMNPGSIGQPPVGARPGYGLLRVSDDGLIKGVTLSYGNDARS